MTYTNSLEFPQNHFPFRINNCCKLNSSTSIDVVYLMKNPNELKELLSELEEKGSSYFVDFITTKGIQAGVIRLHPGEIPQEPHSADEVFYVIEGSGFIKLDHKNNPIKQGTFIFVPAGSDVYGNTRDLVIFYALGK